MWHDSWMIRHSLGQRKVIGKSLEPAADFPTFRLVAPYLYNTTYWLVVWNMALFFRILGIITPTDSHIFQRGWNHQPAYDWVPCLTFEQLCSKLWARAVENSHEQHEFLVSHSTDSTVATFAMAAFRRVVAAAALAVTSVLAETQQFATVPLLGGPLDDNLEIPTQFHQH